MMWPAVDGPCRTRPLADYLPVSERRVPGQWARRPPVPAGSAGESGSAGAADVGRDEADHARHHGEQPDNYRKFHCIEVRHLTLLRQRFTTYSTVPYPSRFQRCVTMFPYSVTTRCRSRCDNRLEP